MSISQGTRPETTFLGLIADSQQHSGKTDQEIGTAMGFDSGNVFSLIKTGAMKLPVSMVKQLAEAIDCPAADLLRIVLEDQAPDLLAAIESIWEPMGLTGNEKKLVESFRHLAKGHDVAPLILDGSNVIALITQ
jgi:hypothetical protein